MDFEHIQTEDDVEGMDAFFSNLTGQPVEKKEDPAAAPQDDQEAPQDDTQADDQGEQQEGSEDPSEGQEDPDAQEIEWGEEGNTTKAALRDLKAAYAVRQEAEAKAQAAAQAAQEFSTKTERAVTALNKVVEAARKEWEPYSKLDWLEISRDPNITQAEFAALRAEAQRVEANLKTYTEELEGTLQAQRDAQAARYREEAKACAAALQDPTTGIPGFNAELYNGMIDFATKEFGADKNALLSITAPWALKMVHEAMLYRQGQSKATQAVQKVVNKPTKVLTPRSTSQGSGKSGMKDAMKALRDSGGSIDAAADAFFASFNS